MSLHQTVGRYLGELSAIPFQALATRAASVAGHFVKGSMEDKPADVELSLWAPDFRAASEQYAAAATFDLTGTLERLQTGTKAGAVRFDDVKALVGFLGTAHVALLKVVAADVNSKQFDAASKNGTFAKQACRAKVVFDYLMTCPQQDGLISLAA